MDTIVALIAIFFVIAIYFLPVLMAGPGHPKLSAVFWLNFLTGWTGLGWLAALIIALTMRE